MPDVLGLDLGLANVGAATITQRGTVQHWVHRSPAGAGDVDDLVRRIRSAARFAVTKATTGTVLVVIEGPSYGSAHGSAHERGAVWWRVVERLRAQDVPVAVVAPATLKRHATGNGNASKGDMKRAAAEQWPGHGLARVTPDEADALHLAGMGAHHLGWTGPWLKLDATVLDAVTWPHVHVPTHEQGQEQGQAHDEQQHKLMTSTNATTTQVKSIVSTNPFA